MWLKSIRLINLVNQSLLYMHILGVMLFGHWQCMLQYTQHSCEPLLFPEEPDLIGGAHDQGSSLCHPWDVICSKSENLWSPNSCGETKADCIGWQPKAVASNHFVPLPWQQDIILSLWSIEGWRANRQDRSDVGAKLNWWLSYTVHSSILAYETLANSYT